MINSEESIIETIKSDKKKIINTANKIKDNATVTNFFSVYPKNYTTLEQNDYCK
jgi:hypothetical protein